MEKLIFTITFLIAFIVCLFLAWYFYHKARHKERLMLIEKGINPDESLKKESPFMSPWLKVGIVVTGLSIGLGIVGILASFELLSSDAFPLSILGLCGGISMVIANYVNKAKS